MTGGDPLPALRLRLRSDLHRVVGQRLAPQTAFVTQELTGTWVDDARRQGAAPRATVTDHIDKLAVDLSSSRGRERLIAGLAAAHAWFDLLPEGVTHPAQVWALQCWAAEACWSATASVPGHTGDGLLDVDRTRLRPIAARVRFLVLSEPFRHRGDARSPWAGPEVERVLGGVFGSGTWPVLVARAQEARDAWRQCLDEHASHHFLAMASPAHLEAELDQVVFCDPPAGKVLTITGAEPLTAPAAPGPGDRALHLDVVERHHLPRFEMNRARRVAWSPQGRHPRRLDASGVLATVAFVAALTAIAGVVTAAMTLAAAAAVISYVTVGIGVLAVGRAFALPLLLRWPASAALGLIVLVGLNGDWWTQAPQPWRDVVVPAAALVGAAYAYLLVEARNHGVGGWLTTLERAAVVLLAGSVHALLVAVVGLVLIVPAFAERGPELSGVLSGHDATAAVQVVVLAAAWCLAAGVFSQILWDDRPITAPLAHSRWRVTDQGGR